MNQGEGTAKGDHRAQPFVIVDGRVFWRFRECSQDSICEEGACGFGFSFGKQIP
jgi:hypothetical protein